MAHAFDGALAALRRVADERTASFADEVTRHRAWLRNCTLDAKSALSQQRQQRAGGVAEAVQVKRPRTNKKATAAETSGAENVEDAEARSGDRCSGRDAAAGAVDVEPESAAAHVFLDCDTACAGSEPSCAVTAAEHLPQTGSRPSCAERASAGRTLQPVVQSQSEPPPPAAANSLAEIGSADMETVDHADALLHAAAAVPLPGSPCAPAPTAASTAQSVPLAAEQSNLGRLAAVPTEPVKQSSKILALQAAEIARRQEERLHHERQAKKEALERQREAAKRAAVMHLPVQQKDAASGDSLAKLYARPPAAGASAFAAKPVESGSKALPRLKQAMEARAQLTEANRRNLELAHKEKDQQSAVLKQAEDDARLKGEEQRARQDGSQQAAKEPANVQSNVSTSQPATVAAVCSVLADAGCDAATRQLAQAAPDASMAAAPGTVLAAPGFTVMQTAVAATDASAPKMSSGSVPSAPTAAEDAFSAPAMPAAVVAPVELQSYEISPYKSGSDSDEEAAERPRKPVPAWARSEALAPVLYAQAKADPDAIFLNPARTCSLDDVFQCAGNKKRDFSRRGSSGNWTEDQLTWKEEQSFKRRMGYVAAAEATPRSVAGSSRTLPAL